MKPLSAMFRDAAGFLAFVFRRWSEDRCPQVAGSLAFTTLLAIVPLFIIVVAVLSTAPFFAGVMAQIKIFLLLNLVPEIAGRIITVYMTEFAASAANLTTVSLAALFAMAMAMLFTVDHGLNAIWRVQRRRPLWLSVAGYSALLALGPILVGLSLSATTWLVTFSLDQVDLSIRAQAFLLRIVPVSVSAMAFFLVYRFFPNRPVPARHALAGGAFAAFIFEAMKSLFATWIQLVPTYRLVYGAFASIPIFLLWLHLAWLVVLLGAEFTAALGHWPRRLQREAAIGAEGVRAAREIERALSGRGRDALP